MASNKKKVKTATKSKSAPKKRPQFTRRLSVLSLFVGLPGLMGGLVFSHLSAQKSRSNEEIAPFTLNLENREQKIVDTFEEFNEDKLSTEAFAATHHPDFVNTAYTKEMILDDIDSRISSEFDIPKELRDRVAFWFDIYAKHSSNIKVIHHSDYPWLVFETVDMSRFYIANRASWKSAAAANKFVDSRRKIIARTLKRLGSMNSSQLSKLNDFESSLVEIVKDLPGSLQKNLRRAGSSLRVQLGQKNFIHLGLTRSRPYLDTMEDIFVDYGLPSELTRLPFVESSFNVKAISKVGASGIWQFMPSIGRKYLHISSDIDERNSPLKATTAAARLLRENFRILGSWELALTAYNHGPGGVKKASRHVKSNELHKMISGYSSKRFSFASKNFYCSFLAALYAEKYHEEIFGEIPSHFHKKIDSMKLSRSLRPKELASMVDLDIKEFVEYNYDLKKAVHRNSKIPKGLEVFFPKKDLNQSGDASSETTLSPEVGTATRETPNAS